MAAGAIVREPIYQQLNDRLKRLLRGREFRAGDQFLTERQVAERFGVSRITANKAVSNLVSEGLLEFRKGVGTFVREVLDVDLRRLVSFTGKARGAGMRPSTRILEFRTGPAREAPPAVRSALKARRGDALHYMERLRLADGNPVILERRWVAAVHCPRLPRRALDGSLYALWTRRFGLDIAGADQAIRGVLLEGGDARLLRARSGSPGLEVSSTGFLAGGAPLWWERTLYRGDAWEFRNRLGPLRASGPAVGDFIKGGSA